MLAQYDHTPAVDISGIEAVWGLEGPLSFILGILAVVAFVRFFPFGKNRAYAFEANPGLGLLRLGLVFAGLWFWWVLAHAADGQILGFYTYLYVALGAACLLWGSLWRPILGVDLQGDVVERGNLAAGIVLFGFVLGTAFAFGGALSGSDTSCAGPRMAGGYCQAIIETTRDEYAPGTVGYGGWHVVVVFFLLAYLELRTTFTMVDRIGGGLSRQARSDREGSAGLLLAGTAIACGLVSGRAAAGDFEGWGAALADYYHRLWPLLLIPFVACAAGFVTNGKPSRHAIRTLTAVGLVAAGAAWYILT